MTSHLGIFTQQVCACVAELVLPTAKEVLQTGNLFAIEGSVRMGCRTVAVPPMEVIALGGRGYAAPETVGWSARQEGD